MYSVHVNLETSGETGLFEAVSNRLRKPAVLMRRIGEYGVSQAQFRLTQVLKPDAEVRTGSLANSLTVFEVTDTSVTIGSNLIYAAQVHHGGTIRPTAGKKALAIPVLAALQRQQLGPLDIDPNREHLFFLPSRGGKWNVVGVLFNPEEKSGRLSGYPAGPLFALATSVDQQARPYLYFDDEDLEVIWEELFAEWVRG